MNVLSGHARALKLLPLVFALGLSACSEEPLAGGSDQGTVDTGTMPEDTGTPPIDMGTSDGPDLGGPADTGMGTDMGPDFDGGPGADGGPVDMGADPNNPNNNMLDSDCDGLSDAEEFSTVYPDGNQTDPNNSDSDGDGIPDGVEVGRTGPVPGTEMTCTPAVDADPSTTTLPTNGDTDGDGIPDGAEDANQNGQVDPDESDPRSTDTDGDGLPDNVEDANQNGARDAGELNPANPDSDGDLIADGIEDANLNGQVDAGETDPLNVDTDGDGLNDGDEDTNRNGQNESYETSPINNDTDCDGLSDSDELANGTSPLVADSDNDGLSDGLELGVMGPLPGSDCPPMIPVDVDSMTNTNPALGDSDNDGIPDGVEDANQNGQVDPGETDPNNPDSDGDGLSDGDEVLLGTDPLDPLDPTMEQGGGINAVCADANLKVLDFNVGGSDSWTLATEQSFAYAPITVNAAGSGIDVGAIDDSTNQVTGFVMRMPLLGGAQANSAAQAGALDARLAAASAGENVALTLRTSARNIVSHDGFETAVSAFFDVNVSTGQRNAAQMRNSLLRMASNLVAADFTGLPANTGGNSNAFVISYQLLVRTAPQELMLVVAVLDRTTFDDVTNNRSILVNDLTNGTALALANAPVDKGCDTFTAAGQSVADFIWMADISGSTDDDRGRIVTAATQVTNALTTNAVDFRMGVVPHTESDINQGVGAGGDLRGTGFVRDPGTFATYLQDTTGSDGCEFGLEAASNAVDKALPRTGPGVENARRIRDNAVLAVVYISDEYAQEITENECGFDPGGAACNTGIQDVYSTNNNAVCSVVPNATQQACIDQQVQPYINQITSNNGIAFAQVVVPNAAPTTCDGYACPGGQPRNEPGRGYVEVVNATGGTLYTPCNPNPGQALQAIVDAVSGAASQFQLTGPPLSASIRVGVVRVGQGGPGTVDIVPRDKDDGFDYDPVSNSIFFRGFTFRPNEGDLVVASYRVWDVPQDPCGGPCAPGLNCDPQLGVCTCDVATCLQNCGPNETCDGASCTCSCAPNCNNQCGTGEVCNAQTCACECDPNFNGCPAGTVWNTTTCTCECDTNCGGACDNTPLQCNTAACNCQCPSDCGGACTGNTVCNGSTCACDCAPGCDDACPGNSACDPAQDCGCICPANCGGCPDNTVCNPGSCACECAPNCDQACPNLQVCDPNNGCGCVCPDNCGGCGPNETCEESSCRCVPIV